MKNDPADIKLAPFQEKKATDLICAACMGKLSQIILLDPTTKKRKMTVGCVRCHYVLSPENFKGGKA